MKKKVLQYMRSHTLVTRGESLVCGISGGPDSTLLGTMLCELKKPLGVSVTFAHVNYHLRSDSNKDAKHVQTLAKKYNVPLYIHDSKASKTDEASLRKIRFAFFEQIRTRTHAHRIALGHTADDATETLLLALFRGSGLKGLRIMPAKTATVIRPLLFLTKNEVVDYLHTHHIPFVIDSSNAKPTFARNKIRNALLPYIKEEINPNITKTLESAASHIALDYDFLHKKTVHALKEVTESSSKKAVQLNKTKWMALHPSLQLHVLREALVSIKKDIKNVTTAQLMTARKTLVAPTGDLKTIELSGGLRISKKHDKIRLSF